MYYTHVYACVYIHIYDTDTYVSTNARTWFLHLCFMYARILYIHVYIFTLIHTRIYIYYTLKHTRIYIYMHTHNTYVLTLHRLVNAGENLTTMRQKRPTTASKETYYSVKRDMLQRQKRPTREPYYHVLPIVLVQMNGRRVPDMAAEYAVEGLAYRAA
jgi:hypothetical protein